MALLNIFKRKPKKETEVKPAKKPQELKMEKPAEHKVHKAKKPAGESLAWKVLRSPQITEKATGLTKDNQYTFRVFQDASKTEVKKTIESLYGVEVLGVRVIKVRPKKRRLGRTAGWRKGYKKAIVRVRAGQKIEVLPR